MAEAPQKDGLIFRGRVKKKEIVEGKNGSSTRYFLHCDALGVEPVLKVQVNSTDYEKYQEGSPIQTFMDFSVRREGWLTFTPKAQA